MAEGMAAPRGAGLLPLTAGERTLSEGDAGRITALAAHRGRADALAEALQAAHGMALPAPNRATGRAEARAVWFGLRHVVLIGPDPDASLSDHADVTDQSDAWAVVRLEGPGAEDVLARLVPVDMRQATFKRGHTVRTQIMHMSGSITRVGDAAFQIMAFRSMAETLVHDLQTAMEGVAART